MASKKLRILSVVAGVLVLGVAGAYWALRSEVDEIPDQLAEVAAEIDFAELSLDAQGDLPPLRLGDHHGKTVFLVLENRESMSGGEGKQLHRALHRWGWSDEVLGFTIGEAPPAAALMRDKIEKEFLAPMQAEMKLPIYVDYGGEFGEALALTKGHIGFAIFDPSGELVFRHAGDADDATLAEIKQLLGAEEPAPGPPAPAFEIGEFDNADCAGRRCVLVFLDAKVTRDQIPGLEEGGYDGDMKASMGQLAQPSIRIARAIAADWSGEEREKLGGVIVGEGEGWDIEGWPFVAQAAAAREAFGVGEQAALIILDEQGQVAYSETGVIPFWKLMLAADLLGIEPKPYKRRD